MAEDDWTAETLLAEFQSIGEDEVRVRLATKFYSDVNAKGSLAREWLLRRELAAKAEVASRASEAASRAAVAADRAAVASERSAEAAERQANTAERATRTAIAALTYCCYHCCHGEPFCVKKII